jgi:hypothetical protein
LKLKKKKFTFAISGEFCSLLRPWLAQNILEGGKGPSRRDMMHAAEKEAQI